MMEKHRLNAVSLGPVDRLKVFVKARIRARTRRFQERWTKKRTKSHFGLKIFFNFHDALRSPWGRVRQLPRSEGCPERDLSSWTGISMDAVPSLPRA
ncbi:hypothetical protein L3N51_00008 [Metallosphaera sp. J1]|nr:hypothetical protein [Metallosphaera javensis (ex Hofmann et al. 2022)]